MRIVTTLPSATEIVAALGLEPVGVSHECDYPPQVRNIPSITRSRIDADASSEDIDAQVLEAAAEDGVYDIDVETLDALEPELVVTQGMCDVCAVDEVVIERALEGIAAEPTVLTTDPHTVNDVLEDVKRVGRAAGVESRAETVVTGLEARLETVREQTVDIPSAERPRVAIFDWTEPAMIAGHWTAELVSWAGGSYGLADVGERSRPREWEEIVAYDPEIIVIAPCGFDLEQTARNCSDLTGRDGWSELSAVREGRVWALDGNHYCNRPGPRLVDTCEVLAQIIQPDRFDGESDETIAVPLADLSGRLEA
ncbi:cobalamin-binding protein [Halobacteria archaeon AArc-curdl1]|uniref:Cobalamin-binding protein n=1 Tax=Natronosalvus hydrolyticus TaxID=2979988 RepID=A0AAP3E5H1_9EURY|nr:cobalamin-binding protein [Halobacteria archaeon AArc-curdl1]